MKGVTTLEQSRELMEILPLESADMVYQPFADSYRLLPINDHDVISVDKIPAWSLGALVEYLRERKDVFECFEFNYGYSWFLKTDNWNAWGYLTKKKKNIISTHDNSTALNAVVTLIKKLHKEEYL